MCENSLLSTEIATLVYLQNTSLPKSVTAEVGHSVCSLPI
jgi:hypothetical protein